jgi:formylglycine-generating enzyme
MRLFRSALTAVLVCGPACAGCSNEADPRPQWLVEVATDANVPAFADRLLIETGDCVVAPTGCAGSSRELAVGDASVWPVSFGVVPIGDAKATWLRARLYRSDRTIAGVPEAGWTIDATVLLPTMDALTAVGLVMDMRCAGVPSDPQNGTTCDPVSRAQVPSPTLATLDPLALPAPGSWANVPCTAPAPEGMACLPGGGFVLGDRLIIPDLVSSEYEATPERLVTLSPFFLDVDELTVGQMRDLVNRQLVSSEPAMSNGTVFRESCTYLGAQDDRNDALPVNCLGPDLAEKVCEALDKQLPSEAQLEYAAGNGVAETPYPWGYDRDACTLAAVDLGAHCRADPNADPYGPMAGGSATDVTLDGIRNLAGNVSEWAIDASAAYTDPCWADVPVPAPNPVCNQGGTAYPHEHGVRGGAWRDVYLAARTATRFSWNILPVDWVGFRCAQPHP